MEKILALLRFRTVLVAYWSRCLGCMTAFIGSSAAKATATRPMKTEREWKDFILFLLVASERYRRLIMSSPPPALIYISVERVQVEISKIRHILLNKDLKKSQE